MGIKNKKNSGGSIDTEQANSAVFRLLSHHHRRITIQYLNTVDGPTTVNNVVDQISLLEGEDSFEPHERIYASLVHTHLPKLAAGDIIKYQPKQGLVELKNQDTNMLSYLELNTDS